MDTGQFIFGGHRDWRLLLMLLDGALKSTLLLSLAAACSFCWRNASAATRHLIWAAAMLGTVSLLFLVWVTPPWEQGLLGVGARIVAGNELTVVLAFGAENAGQQSPPPRLPNGKTARTRTSQDSQPAPWTLSGPTLKVPWVTGALAVWCSGLISILGVATLDRFRLAALKRNARPANDPALLALLNQLRRSLCLRRPVLLFLSEANIVPITWGSLRPAILLPVDARNWTQEQKSLVLLHELGHVKRWDCLAQIVGRLACAAYWFNPLVWLAARQMRIERERACDEIVVANGIKPSEYARELVGLAKAFAAPRRVAGIAMADSSHLKSRVLSILESTPSQPLGLIAISAIWLALAALLVGLSGNQAAFARDLDRNAQALLKQQLALLRSFSAAKLKQSQELAARAGEKINPEFQRFFAAATSGDSQTLTNMYEDFKRRHPQYSHGNNEADTNLIAAFWSPVLEICLAYDQVIRCDPKYSALLADGIIRSIPRGSIYFGGTDPGRGVPTAFEKSHSDGDPFFVVTQNALADGTYLKYLREMYGGKIYTPTDKDSQRCFNSYLSDAAKRLEHDQRFPLEPKQLRPGENVRVENRHVEVSGQAAVMGINALLAKLMVDQNTNRAFYIEESFPLDWMYPHLKPHGLILKINPDPLGQLSDEVLARDRAYWGKLTVGMVGDWLREDTSVKDIAEFIERIYVRKDLGNFSGDPGFVGNDYAKRIFSNLRSSIGGVYAWRNAHPVDSAEAQRMAKGADYAFRQAIVLCPYNPEALSRYTAFLSGQQRDEDARLITSACRKVKLEK